MCYQREILAPSYCVYQSKLVEPDAIVDSVNRSYRCPKTRNPSVTKKERWITSERIRNCVFCDLWIVLSLVHSFYFPLLVALILRLPALGPCSSEGLLDFVLFEEFYRSDMQTIPVGSPADVLQTHHKPSHQSARRIYVGMGRSSFKSQGRWQRISQVSRIIPCCISLHGLGYHVHTKAKAFCYINIVLECRRRQSLAPNTPRSPLHYSKENRMAVYLRPAFDCIKSSSHLLSSQ